MNIDDSDVALNKACEAFDFVKATGQFAVKLAMNTLADLKIDNPD